jgi:hypothetical protein
MRSGGGTVTLEEGMCVKEQNKAKIRKIKINKAKRNDILGEESWRTQIRKAVALKWSEIKWHVKTSGLVLLLGNRLLI